MEIWWGLVRDDRAAVNGMFDVEVVLRNPGKWVSGDR